MLHNSLSHVPLFDGALHQWDPIEINASPCYSCGVQGFVNVSDQFGQGKVVKFFPWLHHHSMKTWQSEEIGLLIWLTCASQGPLHCEWGHRCKQLCLARVSCTLTSGPASGAPTPSWIVPSGQWVCVEHGQEGTPSLCMFWVFPPMISIVSMQC